MFSVSRPILDVRSAPDPASALQTQALRNEAVEVLEKVGAYARIRLIADGYEGYAERSGLAEGAIRPTHRISTRWAVSYEKPDFTSRVRGHYPFGSAVEVVNVRQSERPSRPAIAIARLADGGWMPEAHLADLSRTGGDPLSHARAFIGTPYLFGGKSTLGIDCSALVQVCYAMAGHAPPRDSGPQSKWSSLTAMTADRAEDCAPGWLIFTPGHVMVASGNGRCVHADGIGFVVREQLIDEALSARQSDISIADVFKVSGR